MQRPLLRALGAGKLQWLYPHLHHIMRTTRVSHWFASYCMTASACLSVVFQAESKFIIGKHLSPPGSASGIRTVEYINQHLRHVGRHCLGLNLVHMIGGNWV